MCDCHLTHQPAVVSAVVEEQLLVQVDLCGGAEEQLPIGGVRHQVLLFTTPKHTIREENMSLFNITAKHVLQNIDQRAVRPGFADKHHPVAFVLVRRHDVELQHVVVVHLKQRTRGHLLFMVFPTNLQT